jgi:hypothetical protein
MFIRVLRLLYGHFHIQSALRRARQIGRLWGGKWAHRRGAARRDAHYVKEASHTRNVMQYSIMAVM